MLEETILAAYNQVTKAAYQGLNQRSNSKDIRILRIMDITQKKIVLNYITGEGIIKWQSVMKIQLCTDVSTMYLGTNTHENLLKPNHSRHDILFKYPGLMVYAVSSYALLNIK